ncbi:MAG: hypothetical protein ABI165_17885 [Bryobacteraceae bacterium]
MNHLTVRSSTIFISVGDRTDVYRSVDEVPPRLRKRLHETTNGINSATILIADRKGKEELARAMHGLPSGLRSRLAAVLARRREPGESRRPTWRDWRTWVELMLPGAVGLIIWLAFHVK